MQTYNFGQMRPLPVYNLLAQQTDVEDAQFIPNSKLPAGYLGSDFPWRGTLIVDGVVYDHIGFRAGAASIAMRSARTTGSSTLRAATVSRLSTTMASRTPSSGTG